MILQEERYNILCSKILCSNILCSNILYYNILCYNILCYNAFTYCLIYDTRDKLFYAVSFAVDSSLSNMT